MSASRCSVLLIVLLCIGGKLVHGQNDTTISNIMGNSTTSVGTTVSVTSIPTTAAVSLATTSSSTAIPAISPSPTAASSVSMYSTSVVTASLSMTSSIVQSSSSGSSHIYPRQLHSKSLADVVAVISASLLMLVFMIFAFVFGFTYRRLNRRSIGGVDATKKLSQGTDGTFYQGLAPHSALVLVSSMSSQSFASSPSDAQLNALGHHSGVFFHQGQEPEMNKLTHKNRGLHSASYSVHSKA